MKKLMMLFIPLFLMLSCTVSDEDVLTDDFGTKDDNSLSSDESDESGNDSDTQTQLPDDSAVDDNQSQDQNQTPDEEQSDDEQGINLQEVQQLYSVDKIDSIDISWKSPTMEGFEKTVIVRKTDGYPADINDGSIVYDAIGEGYSDSDVKAGTEYFYRVFACYGELGCKIGRAHV